MERTVTTSRRTRTPHQRSTIELAFVASVLAVTAAYALRRFAGVGEMPIVLATLIVSSVLGWTQPALRAAPRRRAQLAPVIVLDRRRRR